jgi:hypothetical protein
MNDRILSSVCVSWNDFFPFRKLYENQGFYFPFFIMYLLGEDEFDDINYDYYKFDNEEIIGMDKDDISSDVLFKFYYPFYINMYF